MLRKTPLWAWSFLFLETQSISYELEAISYFFWKHCLFYWRSHTALFENDIITLMALYHYLKSFLKVQYVGDLGRMAQEPNKIQTCLYSFVGRYH